ncbi:MAG: 2-succinyl-6-hydroxy-2,4-cyclohexadiene-1-carboxylate synthase [Anaerolineae bacterium]|jgi:2-succinyl-6-hydroxy-2,4-cyclohexadiene-1-carboxylate synthase|nr:2-succinyl-6-hydroxy-2,4-cyclohexadiene-1-carboxylate synthase [Anaerolineae bacterium]
MPRIVLDEGIYYHVEIAGAGPPLVLLHGFSGSSQSWFPVWEALTQRCRVYAIDLPGHGQSFIPSPTDCELYTVAEDLYAVLAELALSRFTLAGYSLGARTALYFALSYPPLLRGLVLESGTPGLKTADERLARRNDDQALAERIERYGVAAFVDEWERLPLWASQAALPAAMAQRQRALRLKNHPVGLANSLRGMGTGVMPPLWAQLTALEVPALLLAGEHDARYRDLAQQMAQALPAARRVIVPGAGHNVHLEQPAAYVAQVLDFMAGLA